MAAILNFVGAFISFKVAATIAKGIVDPNGITLDIILAGLVGAITWNLITWYLGLPSSSSHALIGGVIGSAIIASGWSVVEWDGLWDKVLKPSLIAPFAGIVLAFALILVITWVIARRSPSKVNRVFRRGQLVSGGFVAFTHGTNDAQKTMGIIALALVASGHLTADFTRPPTWVIVSAALAMSAGTYAAAGGSSARSARGSRRSTRRRASRPRRRARRSSGRAHFGFPVSTTHVISGSVMGAGATRGFSPSVGASPATSCSPGSSRFRWQASSGAGMELVTRLPGGDLIVFVLAIAITWTAFLGRTATTRHRLVHLASSPVRAHRIHTIQHPRHTEQCFVLTPFDAASAASRSSAEFDEARRRASRGQGCSGSKSILATTLTERSGWRSSL